MTAALTRYTPIPNDSRQRDLLGSYLDEIRAIPLLSEEQEQALVDAYYRRGDEAAGEALVRGHLRLVSHLAFKHRAARAGALDLIQEGNLGLLRALEKYDPDRGIRFASYARYWIRARILTYLMANHRLVNLATGRDTRRLFFQLEKTRQQLRSAGEEPTPRALAAALEVDEASLNRVDRYLSAPALSFEHPLPSGDPLSATLECRDTPDPEAAVARRKLTDVVRAVMATFEDTLEDERELIIWRERLATADPVSLADLGRRFEVSRERARQLELRLKQRLKVMLLAELGPDIDYEFIAIAEG
jgi:RNA polymerase sigma-32 factor